MEGIMIFSKREQLAEKYEEWLLKKKVKDCPFNVITFLDGEGYFDYPGILESYSLFLTKNGYMDTDWKDEPPTAIDEFMKDFKFKV
jgi:hypothetical protein